jgi:hypothetical protein
MDPSGVGDWDGAEEGDVFGHGVALSSYGIRVAIGAISNNDDDNNGIGCLVMSRRA